MYVCALRPMGEPLSRADVFGYIARLRRRPAESLHSIVEGPFVAFATEHDAQLRLQLARRRQLIAVGDVRLDERAALASFAGLRATSSLSDLELVLAALDVRGESCVREIVGDFAFVVWDASAQKLLAVRDAFGVKPLYWRTSRDLVLFSSEIAPLQQAEEYDVDYITDHLLGRIAPADRTIWRDVAVVPAGGLVRQRGTIATEERYWRAAEFAPIDGTAEAANCERFRDLLERAVATRLTGGTDCWAQLSGGLDSSSVVAVADLVRGCGEPLAGTVTIVDSLGTGDERVYSDAVARRYGLRNEQLLDFWAWQDDGEPPPVTDQPWPMYPFYARERALHRTVHDGGGRVLLSGFGADHYLHGPLDYITDLAAGRQWRAALREVTAWSVATRQSFWTLGRRFLVEPFLPALQRSAAPVQPPRWLASPIAGRATDRIGSRIGRFAQRVAAGLDALPSWLERWPFGHDVEMRYPFLYRPLVEWSLQLPATQRVRPPGGKWILREATRDLLPESVRTRGTKGAIDARILWSLQRERAHIDRMLRDPILAQLGCIEPAALRRAVDAARNGVPTHNVQLFSALALETWLAVRAGQWTETRTSAASAA